MKIWQNAVEVSGTRSPYFLKLLSSVAVVVISTATLTLPASAAQSPGSSYVGSNKTLSTGRTYVLQEPLIIAAGATLTVEPGVELVVLHDKPVFQVAGKLSMRGTKDFPIRIHNAYLLVSKYGSFRNDSVIEIKYVVADNILGVFDSLLQGISVSIEDSSFRGRIVSESETRLRWKKPIYAWLTFLRGLNIQRNSFEKIPGFYLESFISEPRLVVKDNLFIGNSTSYLDTRSPSDMQGHWFKVRNIDEFTGNSFLGMSGPVLKKVNYPRTILDKEFIADGNYWGGSNLAAVSQWLDSDGNGRVPIINSLLELPSDKTLTEESHNDALELSLSTKSISVAVPTGTSSTLTSKQKSNLNSSLSKTPALREVTCIANLHSSQKSSQKSLTERRAVAVCDYVRSLYPLVNSSTSIKNQPRKTSAGAIGLSLAFIEIPGSIPPKPKAPIAKTIEGNWVGSASVFVPPDDGIEFRSLYKNLCLDGTSALGRRFLEIFRFPTGIYCSGDSPRAHFKITSNLPANFEPQEWRIVFDVFVPRFEGSIWAGTGHSMVPTSAMRFYSADSLNVISSVTTEWSSELPSDGVFKASIIRSWIPFDTYFAVGNLRIEAKGLEHQD